MEEAGGGGGGGGGGGELLHKWLEEKVKAAQGTYTGVADAAAAAQKITEELKNDIVATWEKLKTSLAQAGAVEIEGLCSDVAGKEGGGIEEEYLKNLCKGIVEMRYFISGGSSQIRWGLKFESDIKPHEWYPRCIVGTVALSEIYGDHCKLKEVINRISDRADGKLEEHREKDGAKLDKCKGLTDTDILFGKTVLQGTIKDWVVEQRTYAENKERNIRSKAPWRIRKPWEKWPSVCNHKKRAEGQAGEARKKELREENAQSMTTFMKLNNDTTTIQNSGGSSVMPLSDVLIGESKDYSLDLGKLTKVFEDVIQNNNTGTADLAGAIIEKITKQSDEKLGVKTTLEKMFERIESEGKANNNAACKDFGDGNEHSVERKACNHIAAGLKYIKDIKPSATATQNSNDDDKFFKQSMMCAALNFYADQIKKKSQDKCPIDEIKIREMFNDWNGINNTWSSPSCSTSGGKNNCFVCNRIDNEDFKDCKLSVDSSLVNITQPSGGCKDNTDRNKVQDEMNKLLNNEDNAINPKMKGTLSTITDIKTSSFCTQLQCAAKKWSQSKKGKSSGVTWNVLKEDIDKELKALLENMTKSDNQKAVEQYCKDNEAKWDAMGHKQSKTNKAACLLFAAGLKHIYGRGKGQVNGSVKGPSFEQTMGCLFLKEYAKQLKEMAEVKKQGHSWVHPLCDIDQGIDHAFDKSNSIMEASSQCKKNGSTNDCFVCKWDNDDYKDCSIGTDNVKTNVEPLLQSNKEHMQQTLENTVCPILLTDLLTPFLPLAPVSIGLSAMAYYLWKYFGPFGKGGPRFRRSPAEIPGPSVQEQVLDHVEEAGPHEYQLVKERKPRSAPTRTKRSGRANRRTIIEIHFEVLDECQKGDTQLNQKDFLELLVQEFMGSEFMEEEQVPKEEVLMESVPMEGVPMESIPLESVPSLGSGFMV
ncbi:SICAvar, type I [Plasmodium knowlesi strain H]|uniref:SICAvar, type I n=3 Tax=Plasmodium knowlesi TaxID=5850 RepID=A0A1A7VXG3_PLAKH|nr:SICAvar, type I [Plasmodium knowlesi strain H]OTN64637.1 SICAvar type I [Plasmodium knowlesi]CAA9989292.1 SICAvar, type I [Plasmodium knowlesi strain H]SBO26132.1 SICAvar, type I [Plasmodium knowlesi strain H]SBO26808.1 SICAvar, type I [Plasmodium knowlesi strain H]VVS78766.1 SICAvar, type I [Plasmodium knowlesi strain H]